MRWRSMTDPNTIESGSFASGHTYRITRKSWQYIVELTHPGGAVTRQRVRRGLHQDRRPAYNAINRMLRCA